MAESNQPQFLQLGHAPVFLTPATETSFTLSPATEIGDPFAPAIEKAGFVASAEASADETLTSESPAIGSTGGEIFVVNALPALLDTIPDHGASIYGTATVDASNDEIHTSDLIAPRPTTKDLLDCQNRLMAELLTRFTNLVKLATAPEEDGATLEAQAALSLQMDVETTALVNIPYLERRACANDYVVGQSNRRSPPTDPRPQGTMARWTIERYW